MCRTPCCPPQRSSGLGPLIAIIGVVIIAANVLRAILGLLELLVVITVSTVAATAALALVIWAIKRHRQAITASYTLQPTKRAPALPPRYVVAIDGQPAARPASATTPRVRALTSQHEYAVRRFADVITSYDDPAAVEALIHRALQAHHTPPIPRS